MAATNRLFVDFVSGVTDASMGIGVSTISGAFLADLSVVADPDFIALTLDPEKVGGDPEIVWVTAHSASATTATVLRGQEGTAERAHESGIKVVAALTKSAVESHLASLAIAAPVGSMMMYGGAVAPNGWLLCDGQAVSRTTYAALFAAIGTAYGAGDGSTTFGLPDLRQRFPLGKAGSGTGSTLGGTGGSIDHAHSQGNTGGGNAGNTGSAGSHAHSQGNTGSAGSHDHDRTSGGLNNQAGGVQFASGSFEHDHTVANAGSHVHSNPNVNSNGNHVHSVPSHQHSNPNTSNANPPYLVVNFIIRAA